MQNKIKVGIIGATGMVGQNYVRLLENHPWFEITHIAASARSAGKKYSEAVEGRWYMETPLPECIKSMELEDALNVNSASTNCDLVFSAVSLDKKEIQDLEKSYAAAGLVVVSNNSALRMDPFVPMLIPEVNSDHLELIDIQRNHFGWDKGLIVTKPNCGIQSYMAPLDAFRQAGYRVKSVINTNLQALSGAGYSGPYALDMVDNLMHLGGEESKGITEPQKIFGKVTENGILSVDDLKIGSHCVRVPVIHGHMSCVSIGFEGKACSLEEAKSILSNYRPLPQQLDLPSAPKPAINFLDNDNRPQPRLDRDVSNGMAVSLGRLRECPVLDLRFVSLSHNTVRGAAGGAILMAELLVKQEYC